MKVNEFNNNAFRFVHRPSKYAPEFHYLTQWCSETDSWQRVPPRWIQPRAHFDGFEIPDKILAGINEYIDNGTRVPCILISREKHGTRYFDASTLATMGSACLQLLNERTSGEYYCGWDTNFLLEAEAILENRSYFSALRLLESRNDYEYEGFEMEKLTVSSFTHEPKV